MALSKLLHAADVAQAERWSVNHAAIAWKQGWVMSDYDFTGALQLQRADELGAFDNDDDAIAFVKACASAGDATAILALELDRHFEPVIYGADYVSKVHPAEGISGNASQV